VYQFPIENNFMVVMFSDGVASAGADFGQPLQWGDLMEHSSMSLIYRFSC